MVKKYISVDRIAIQKKEKQKIILILTEGSSEAIHCCSVKIKGESTLIYQPDAPQKLGRKVWLETEADLEILE